VKNEALRAILPPPKRVEGLGIHPVEIMIKIGQKMDFINDILLVPDA